MFIPFAFFLNYHSPFSWWLGPLLQALGFLFLGLTRLTGIFYPKFGKRYYYFSAIFRPIGIFLIGWAWVEILAASPIPPWFKVPEPKWIILVPLLAFTALCLVTPLLRRFFLPGLALGVIAFFPHYITGLQDTATFSLTICLLALAWSIWSIYHLGLRPSFLYSKIDDPLITSGPYQFQRHPQLASACIMAFASIFLVIPMNVEKTVVIPFRFINLLVMLLAVGLIVRAEEAELLKRFDEDYTGYRQRVPAFLGFRASRPYPSWKLTASLTFLAYVLANLGFFIPMTLGGVPPRSSFPLTVSLSPYYFTSASVTYRDLRYFSQFFREDIHGGACPDEIKPELLVHWHERDRGALYSPYPQSLFYCGHVYYDPELPEQKPGSQEVGEFRRVDKLPFPLICTKDKVEIAQAMDYDGDGFPQVWVLSIACHDWPEYPYDRPILAEDDESNVINPDFIERIKTGLKKEDTAN